MNGPVPFPAEVRLGRKVVATVEAGWTKEGPTVSFRPTSVNAYWSNYSPFEDGRCAGLPQPSPITFVLLGKQRHVIYDVQAINLSAGTATLCLPPRREKA